MWQEEQVWDGILAWDKITKLEMVPHTLVCKRQMQKAKFKCVSHKDPMLVKPKGYVKWKPRKSNKTQLFTKKR